MKIPFRQKNPEQPKHVAGSDEMTKDYDQIRASDLPIVLYLNQRLTFDVLASLDGGFSHFTTIQTTFAGESSREMAGRPSLELAMCSHSWELDSVVLGE